jgi:hypothetical protein
MNYDRKDEPSDGGLPSCYCVQSRLPVSLLRLFLEAAKGNDIKITNENVSRLPQLRRVWLSELVFKAFGISRLSLVQRFGGGRGSKPNFNIGRTGFATGAAACGARSETVAQLPVELARMQAGLARLTSEVQRTLPQLRASSEAALQRN